MTREQRLDELLSDEQRRRLAVVRSRRDATPRYRSLRGRAGDAVVDLTPRQQQVLQLLADGVRAYKIPARLDVALCTVETHLKGARSKLDAKNSAHAVAIAYRAGLID